MTQRLTPERIEEIRARVMSPMGVTWFGRADDDSRALLDELDALRAELAGAEERGRQRVLETLDALIEDKNHHLGWLCAWRFLREQLTGSRFTAAEQARDGTGTTPPDAGESKP